MKKHTLTHFCGIILSLFSALIAFSSCNRPAESLCEPLDDALWKQSVWISAADAPVVSGKVANGSRAADGASWFVIDVPNEGRVVSAKWMTTALGVYDLYVNGELVGEEVLKPGFTHYAKTRLSFTYDVTSLISRRSGAQNRFAAQVTPGWWADKIVTPAGHEGMIGRKCAFRSVLELRYSDGSVRIVGTDTLAWRAGIAGSVKHAAIFDGEVYDAGEAPGYEAVDRLGVPEINNEFGGKIIPTDGAEVYMREDLALEPVKAYVWKGVTGNREEPLQYGRVNILREYSDGGLMELAPGETLVVDFGQNCAGVPSFVFKAAGGTVLTCLPAELLNDGNGAADRGMDGPEGSCHRKNLRIPDTGMILQYKFAPGDAFVYFRPRCTFFGYRYVSVTADDNVQIASLLSIPVTSIRSDMETGTIVTGNESVNKLISNTVWGQRSNYLSVTTDCPQRNERLGWTADTQVFTETGTFFADTRAFFHKWTRDMRDTQSPLGGFPGVAPMGQYGADDNNMMRVGWADAGVIVPWTVWKQFGDVGIIDENWDAMERFMDHVADTKYDHKALAAENGNYQWADWLSYEPLESCGRGIYKDVPAAIEYWNYLSASYWAIDAAMMCDMALASGRNVAKYSDMLSAAKAYIRERFFDDEGRFVNEILNTMQTPALFALKNGILVGLERERMIAALRENFALHDYCLQTGFLGTSIIMQTLTENGMSDIAYALLFQHRNPSWLYSVDNGATTIWERWNSYTLESGMAQSGMNSFNHYAYGCVCQWIWETAAGIATAPLCPGDTRGIENVREAGTNEYEVGENVREAVGKVSGDVNGSGFRQIVMRPVPDRRLGFLDAEYRSAAGTIRSSWRYVDDRWIWLFSVPSGSIAYVTLPGSDEVREYGPGFYDVCLEGI